LFIWREIKDLMDSGEAVPKWTREYLAAVADELLAIKKVEKGAGKLTMDALGMHSGRVYKEYQKESLRSNVYWMIEEEKKVRSRGEIDSSRGDVYADVATRIGKKRDIVRQRYFEEKAAVKALEELDGDASPDEIAAVFKKIFFS